MTILSTLSDIIKGKASITQSRSPKWSQCRKNHLKKNPFCACCGGTSKLEVHHIIPFNINPALELEPSNLITLCESSSYGVTCHMFVGHLGNYKSFNIDVVKDSAYWYNKLDKKPL